MAAVIDFSFKEKVVVVRAFCANQLAVLLYDKYLLAFIHKDVSNGPYLIDPT